MFKYEWLVRIFFNICVMISLVFTVLAIAGSFNDPIAQQLDQCDDFVSATIQKQCVDRVTQLKNE